MRKEIRKVIWFGKKCIARGGGWWKRDQKKIHRWLFISGNGRSGRSGVRVDNASYWSRCFCGAYCFPISRINQYVQTDRVTWTRDYYWQMHSFDKRVALDSAFNAVALVSRRYFEIAHFCLAISFSRWVISLCSNTRAKVFTGLQEQLRTTTSLSLRQDLCPLSFARCVFISGLQQFFNCSSG